MYGPYDERIKKLITFKFSVEEICKALDVSQSYLYSRKRIMIARGKLLPDITFASIGERIKWEKETREKLYSMINFHEDADTDVIMQYFEYVKEKRSLEEEKYKYTDMRILSKAILLDESLITPENVKILVCRFDTK